MRRAIPPTCNQEVTTSYDDREDSASDIPDCDSDDEQEHETQDQPEIDMDEETEIVPSDEDESGVVGERIKDLARMMARTDRYLQIHAHQEQETPSEMLKLLHSVLSNDVHLYHSWFKRGLIPSRSTHPTLSDGVYVWLDDPYRELPNIPSEMPLDIWDRWKLYHISSPKTLTTNDVSSAIDTAIDIDTNDRDLVYTLYWLFIARLIAQMYSHTRPEEGKRQWERVWSHLSASLSLCLWCDTNNDKMVQDRESLCCFDVASSLLHITNALMILVQSPVMRLTVYSRSPAAELRRQHMTCIVERPAMLPEEGKEENNDGNDWEEETQESDTETTQEEATETEEEEELEDECHSELDQSGDEHEQEDIGSMDRWVKKADKASTLHDQMSALFPHPRSLGASTSSTELLRQDRQREKERSEVSSAQLKKKRVVYQFTMLNKKGANSM